MYQEIQVFEIASWPFELDSCAFVSMIMARSMSQTTERLNLWSANDLVLARWGFVRFIALRCMFIWCFVSTCKSPSSNSVYKIPCKNDLRWDFDDCSLPSHWVFFNKESYDRIRSLLVFSSEFSTLPIQDGDIWTKHVENLYKEIPPNQLNDNYNLIKQNLQRHNKK